jgi:hypothetical protein
MVGEKVVSLGGAASVDVVLAEGIGTLIEVGEDCIVWGTHQKWRQNIRYIAKLTRVEAIGCSTFNVEHPIAEVGLGNVVSGLSPSEVIAGCS